MFVTNITTYVHNLSFMCISHLKCSFPEIRRCIFQQVIQNNFYENTTSKDRYNVFKYMFKFYTKLEYSLCQERLPIYEKIPRRSFSLNYQLSLNLYFQNFLE